MKYITFLFLLITQLSFAQSKSLTKVIDKIDYQNDTMRAVFDWMTDNIKYDVRKLKQMEKGVNFFEKGNFKSAEVYKASLLKDVIKKKKGVCQDYSILFDAIVKELGYESFIVSGITKGPNGRVSKSVGHTWNAVRIDGVWKLYDSTWGAGYVNDKRKFVKKYFAQWYDIDAEEMKERHLPFDPIWQLSDNPMTFKEFKKGKHTEDEEAPYDYNSMIDTYLENENKKRYVDELKRMELSGGNSAAIKKHKRFLQRKIDNFDHSNNVDLINNTVDKCRESSMLYSEYINEGKNKRFKGKKWTLEYSKSTMLDLKDQVTESIAAFDRIETKKSKSKSNLRKMVKQSKKLLGLVDKEIVFLEGEM